MAKRPINQKKQQKLSRRLVRRSLGGGGSIAEPNMSHDHISNSGYTANLK